MEKIRVELRQRNRGNGKISLYLDYYPAVIDPETGKKKRQEFLKLYILEKPKGQTQRDYNKSVLETASQILANRINQVRKSDIYSDDEITRLKAKELGNLDFISYFQKQKRKQKGSTYQTWLTTEKYLTAYFKDGLRFSDIDEAMMSNFKDFLLNSGSLRSGKSTLSRNTALSYFNKVKATLKQAFRDKIIKEDINARISPIKPQETRRDFLSLEELQRLVKADCQYPIMKRAALFSALTGLRFSDVVKLKGNEVQDDNTGYYLTFTQQKTESVENHYISKQAYELLGDFTKDDSQVFRGLKYSAHNNMFLTDWIKAAGINKKITFHNFRHTYATLQLDSGTDIYTVSKLLGHKSVKTTQIYAKVLDDRKREAANRIKLDF